MSLYQEFSSWFSPSPVDLSSVPAIGSKAPSTAKLSFPDPEGRSTVVTFLRHCGCPFAEAAFLNLRARASENPSVHFVAVSHSTPSHTESWVKSVGGPGNSNPITVIVDTNREVYAKWGLGTASWGHTLSPSGLWACVTLGREKGIWNRPTESGSRWQTGGKWAVDSQGFIRWGGPSSRADEVPEFKDAVEAVSSK